MRVRSVNLGTTGASVSTPERIRTFHLHRFSRDTLLHPSWAARSRQLVTLKSLTPGSLPCPPSSGNIIQIYKLAFLKRQHTVAKPVSPSLLSRNCFSQIDLPTASGKPEGTQYLELVWKEVRQSAQKSQTLHLSTRFWYLSWPQHPLEVTHPPPAMQAGAPS